MNGADVQTRVQNLTAAGNLAVTYSCLLERKFDFGNQVKNTAGLGRLGGYVDFLRLGWVGRFNRYLVFSEKQQQPHTLVEIATSFLKPSFVTIL